ncbi:LPS assembly lipoprotein LptE [Terriglobus tenax]|uniref:LPS assembly lipoprotein LptE n=1 Tax=Terriglobus tenax TaxID=1111115 RepID=UPI0021DFF24C|nr:LptE family protein [Terriglobus tenax]
MKRFLFLFALLPVTGCGYHRVGQATHIPAGVRTLAVPMFKNHTQSYHTEVAFTQAVVHALNNRTRYVVTSDENPGNSDALLTGTIVSQTIAPLTYDSTSGQTSSYLITIVAKVTLTAPDGRVLYKNDGFSFREQYQSTQDLSAFLQEDSPAVQRLARNFAQSLVSDMLESF